MEPYKRVKALKQRLKIRENASRTLIVLFIIIFYGAIFSIIYPHTFFTIGNLTKILMSLSTEIFVVIGMGIILISGHLDLSLGANMALSGIICGSLIKTANMPMIPAIMITLLFAVIMGLINGTIVAIIKINPIISTLSTGFIFQGIAVWLAGPGFADFPISFQSFAQGKLFGLPLPIIYMLIISILCYFLLSKVRFFRKAYYIGGSLKAAELSGINIVRSKMVVFVLAAILASFAGIVSASRFNTAMSQVGSGVELRAITACIIGGISFSGGSGDVVGATLGALFIAILNNSLIIAGLEQYWQSIAIGTILIIAIVINEGILRKQED